MRIAIAGASGTGKTTLAQAIAERYHLPINPVGARSVAKSMGFDNPYDVDAAGRRVEFQRKLFEQKRAWELEHEAFVTDRSYFDNLTYCALHMAEHLEDNAIEEFTRAMERYDLVIVLDRKDFQRLDDRIRKTSVAYHALYERLLRALIWPHGPNYGTSFEPATQVLQPGTPCPPSARFPDRLSIVLHEIESYRLDFSTD
jgi:predicted ATPase